MTTEYKRGLLAGNRGMPRITEEEYFGYLGIIREQLKYEDMCAMCFNTILPNDSVTGFKSALLAPIIELLQEITNDKDKWLDYYVFECDMGASPKKVKLGGSNMCLDSDTKLWNLITFR